MTYINSCAEVDDLGGGRFRHIQHIKPVAYLRNGALRPMGFALAASKDIDLPVGVDEALLFKLDLRIAGKSPLWEVRGADRSKYARFVLLNANNVAGQRVNEHEYIYPNALDGADLAFTYYGHRVAADFRLKKGHPSLVAWRMDAQAGFDPKRMLLGDLTIRQPVLLPPEGKDVASIPLVWDVAEESGRYILRCALPAGDYVGWTLDPTLSLQPDAAAGKDSLVNVGTGGTPPLFQRNYGAISEVGISAAGIFGLLEFDLSSIVATATCTAATLSMFASQTGAANAWGMPVYSIASGNAGWVEGEGTGTAYAASGEHCWEALAADGLGGVTTAWAGTAGLSTSGTDYEATAIGALSGNREDAVGTEYQATLTTTRVAGWFGAVNTNYGMTLRWTVGNQHFLALSDHATAGYRPKLVVVYTVPGGGNVFQSAIMHSSLYGKTLVR